MIRVRLPTHAAPGARPVQAQWNSFITRQGHGITIVIEISVPYRPIPTNS